MVGGVKREKNYNNLGRREKKERGGPGLKEEEGVAYSLFYCRQAKKKEGKINFEKKCCCRHASTRTDGREGGGAFV